MSTTRRTVAAALVAAGVLLLGGCGQTDGTGGPAGAGEAGAGRSLPAELVGSWSTERSANFDTTVFSFYEDGFFTQEAGTSMVTGRYEVRDGTLVTFPEEGKPKEYTWRVGEGGCLHLDGVRHCPYS
ncbi:hypothetical protein IQ279_02080 [Streptomyces verrucosisporus]|uniref:hypothetical protein n=1 Tax=Streptomyces verrucosisporus TaxID=1695161 RepID=UPI0019D259F8|nr:hypothetical protein [Streptomyces verrucosisporus]MBN3928445.1 hypothetical protein [Streptomyces verrucosisporus]